MRVTNNMIINNSIRNINKTKELTSKLNDQMTSQKKITKASEDPVIAIRSLRLRNTQAQVDQYLTNNINDAEKWLESTEDALNNIDSALEDAYNLFVQGANGDSTIADKKEILASLQALVSEVYQEANADFNGRTLFTGYKTGSTLTFTEDVDTEYTITEPVNSTDIREKTFYSTATAAPSTLGTVSVDDDGNLTITDDGTTTTYDGDEEVTYAEEYNYNVIRLSYDDLDTSDTITKPGDLYYYNESTGKTVGFSSTVVCLDTYEDFVDLAESGSVDEDSVYFIYETGEMVLNDTVNSYLNAHPDFSLYVTYTKSGFDKDEIRPEMYFSCTDNTNGITYTKEDQPIEYTISDNTTLEVNKQGDEFLTADFYRDIEELSYAMQQVTDAQAKVDEIQSMIDSSAYSGQEGAQSYLSNLLAAAQSELDYATDNVNNLFSNGISYTQSYLTDVANADADVGNKMSQLELVETRMTNQQTTVEALIADNENEELTEIVIKYTAAYNAYESALLAASKASENTLLDYL
ncbi:MAG: flagellar hook-associated protein FlgL [Eubacterium sp.]|nr:flagellar hook-associated protein FlgL [Eubacterium sp.]